MYQTVKCFGVYDGAGVSKRWDDLFHLTSDKVQPRYVPDCSKHVLAQLYYEHLYDYNEFTNNRSRSRGNRKKWKNHIEVDPDDLPLVSISEGEGRYHPGSVKEMDDVQASGVRSSWKRRNQKGDRMASSERHANNDGATWNNATFVGAW